MSANYKNKVVVVTGASKGIGAEIARQFGAAGASVVVNYSSSKAGADKVVDAIQAAGGKAVAVQANLAVEADVRKLFAETKKAFGRVDVLVNNAGIYDMQPLENITADSFHNQFNLNVLGLLFASQEAAKLMSDGGSIVNISSIVAVYTPPASAVYSATKAAVNAITSVLAKELGPKKIRVNAVNPGLVETEGTTSLGLVEGDFHKMYEQQAPLGRIGAPGDIAPAVMFLASPDASWVTGETLYVGGGFK
ncbi:MAG: glucose 1-dehydrogenase [Planctomycetes bacterium]|nr:glucose 1-dehydrogenase [Planctomycetota bacterium]